MENNNVDIKSKNESENENIEFSTDDINSNNRINKINVSMVVDINEVGMDEYMRISNMLIAVMNYRDSKISNSTINMKHYPNERNLKVMLWGNAEFIKEMLELISMLTQSNNNM